MIARNAALRIARLAGEVHENTGTKARVADGYTRVDPVEIAEGYGVDVLVRPLDQLLGIFLREGQPGILLNSLRPAGMFHMTCAHELGHYFLGHGTTADHHIHYKADASSFELEADQFAYALMAPLWLIVHVLKAQGWNWGSLADPARLYQLSLRLGLSYAGTVWSLVRHNKLDAAIAKRLAAVKPAVLKAALVPEGIERDNEADVWHIGPADKDMILEPRASDRIVMELPSHASAGYLWSIDDAKAEGFMLRPLLVDGSAETARAEGDLAIGSAGTMRYELEFGEVPAETEHATLPTQIPLVERQPWAKGKAAADTFEIKTKLEIARNGLSLGSRQRRLLEASQP